MMKLADSYIDKYKVTKGYTISPIFMLEEWECVLRGLSLG